MSRNGTLLPIPDDPYIAEMFDAWNAGGFQSWPHPRAAWLREIEDTLREHYPQSSSADRKLTARHIAPFQLALGPNVV